jgi:hypothetical protein
MYAPRAGITAQQRHEVGVDGLPCFIGIACAIPRPNLRLGISCVGENHCRLQRRTTNTPDLGVSRCGGLRMAFCGVSGSRSLMAAQMHEIGPTHPIRKTPTAPVCKNPLYVHIYRGNALSRSPRSMDATPFMDLSCVACSSVCCCYSRLWRALVVGHLPALGP